MYRLLELKVRLILILTFLILSNICNADSYFLKQCENFKDENFEKENKFAFEQIKWLKLIFNHDDCNDLKDSLLEITSLTEILPYQTNTGINKDNESFKPSEFRSTNLKNDLFSSQWAETKSFFTDLSLFREFTNIKHLFVESDTDDGLEICKTLQQIKSIKSITLHGIYLNKDEINCLKVNEVKIYISGIYDPNEASYKLKDQIKGIENYNGNINQLSKYKALNYLGLYNVEGVFDIHAFTGIRNLSILELNIKNILNVEAINKLENLKYLTLKCSNQKLKEGETTPFCDNRSLNIDFLQSLNYLTGLSLSDVIIENDNVIQKLQKLKYLRISNSNIRDLKSISSLKGLKFLDVSGNRIQKAKDLYSLNSLEYLNISDNELSDIDSLFNLKNLEFLAAGRNSFRKAHLKNPSKKLKLLNLDSHPEISDLNEMNRFSAYIANGLAEDEIERIWVYRMISSKQYLKNSSKYRVQSKINVSFDVNQNSLKYFSAANTYLEGFSGATHLRSLKYLDLSGTKSSFYRFSLPGSLEYLNLNNSALPEICFDKLLNLKFLDVSRVKNVSKSLEVLKAEYLSTLIIKNSKLEKVPDLSGAPNLLEINFENNLLNSLEGLSQEKLVLIDLSNNNFDTFPNLSNLPILKLIILNNNFIKDLEHLMTATPEADIYLQQNSIEDLSIFKSKELEKLRVILDQNPVDKTNKEDCPKDSLNQSVRFFCSSLL